MAELLQRLDGDAYESRTCADLVHVLGEAADQHDDHAELGRTAAERHADGLDDVEPGRPRAALGRQDLTEPEDERQHHHDDTGREEDWLGGVLFEYVPCHPDYYDDSNE